MKAKLKIWVLPPYECRMDLIYRILPERYDIEITHDEYNIIIANAQTPIDNLKCDGVKLLYTEENIVPDFNFFDYAIGFDYLEFGDRYLRLPLYCLYPEFDELITQRYHNSDENRLNRNFCSMVVSNGHCASPIRKDFFDELSKYKRVDSAGKYLNNMGGGYLEDKQAFISKYKFNIAFENSSVSGYTTEKIVQAMAADTLPIYWGNPLVKKDFNPKSYVNLQDFRSIKECVDYIVYLDQNDEEYLEVLKHDKFNKEDNYKDYKERLWSFVDNILSQDNASRISPYGWQAIYRKKLTENSDFYKKYHTINSDAFLKRYYAFKTFVYKLLQRF